MKAIMMSMAMTTFARNSATNVLPALLGLFFKTEGTSSRGMQMLSNISLVISSRAADRIKEHLSRDAIRNAVSLIQSGKLFCVIADNINLYLRKHQQRLTNQNTMLHATNSAILRINDDGIDSERVVDLTTKLGLQGARKRAEFKDILPDTSDAIALQEGCEHLIAEIIVNHMPQSRRWRNRKSLQDHVQKDMPREAPIPVEKTETHPFGVFDVNEGSKKGIIQLLEAIQERTGLSREEWSNKVCILSGDWLTSQNYQLARRDRADDKIRYDHLEYAQELSQLFHFALQATQMIIRTHLGNGIEDPTSLSAHKGLLRRVWDPNKPNYAAAKALIRHSLIARIQHAIKCVPYLSCYSQIFSCSSGKSRGFRHGES